MRCRSPIESRPLAGRLSRTLTRRLCAAARFRLPGRDLLQGCVLGEAAARPRTNKSRRVLCQRREPAPVRTDETRPFRAAAARAPARRDRRADRLRTAAAAESAGAGAWVGGR